MATHQDTPAAIGVRQRLHNLGDTLHISQNDLMRLYFLDGFLRRLAASPAQSQFVLGGAFFLFKLVFGPTQARLTQDLDCSLSGLAPDPDVLRALAQTILVVPAPDELLFDPESVRVNTIMATNPDLGIRLQAQGYLGKARDTITLDASASPIVPPGPQARLLPSTLPSLPPIPVWTVPLEGVMAGKVESMLRRGRANTRFKDYWDIARLAETQPFDGTTLTAALRATCVVHGTVFTATGEVFAASNVATDPAQLMGWRRFLAQARGATLVKPPFAEVLLAVRALYGPVLQDTVQGKTWSPQAQQWS